MGCCRTLSGIIRDCDANVGGIKRAWIACFDEAGTPTVTNDEISALGDATAFHEYEFRRQTGSVEKAYTIDDAAGTTYVESTIVLQFSKMETQKRVEIVNIAQSDVVVIIEDNNNKFWYFGFDYGVRMSEGGGETGTAFADLNAYTLTLVDVSKELPYELSDAAIAALLGEDE